MSTKNKVEESVVLHSIKTGKALVWLKKLKQEEPQIYNATLSILYELSCIDSEIAFDALTASLKFFYFNEQLS